MQRHLIGKSVIVFWDFMIWSNKMYRVFLTDNRRVQEINAGSEDRAGGQKYKQLSCFGNLKIKIAGS